MVDFVNGKVRFRAWPKPRGKPKHLKTREQNARFAAVQLATKYIAPQIYKSAVEQTADTPLLPRDVLTMMLYNRLYAFTLDDGRTLWPMTAVKSVSASLDVLCADDDHILIRRNGVWVGEPVASIAGSGLGLFVASRDQGGFVPGGQFVPNTPNLIQEDQQGWWDAATGSVKPSKAGWYLLSGQARTLGNCFWFSQWLGGSAGVEITGKDDGIRQRSIAGTALRYFAPGDSGFRFGGLGNVNDQWEALAVAHQWSVIGPVA